MSGAGIVATKDVRLIHCGLQLLVARGALGSAGETVLEVPAPATTKQTSDSNGLGAAAAAGAGDGDGGQGQEQLGCAAAAVSPAGDLIAVCDDRKQVCVFRVSDLRDQYQIIMSFIHHPLSLNSFLNITAKTCLSSLSGQDITPTPYDYDEGY